MMKKLNVPYRGIFCGKLRRYFSLRNVLDFFLVPAGIVQSFFIILKFRPQVVFCKGGFVSFPVAVGAKMAGKKVILHESDVTPGLANRLSARFADKILVSHRQTEKFFPICKVETTGNPVRKWIREGNKEAARKITGLHDLEKPVVLLMGGSQGAEYINEFVRENIAELTKKYAIIHICGKGNLADVKGGPDYYQTEYAGDELKDLYALCDLVVSRAGANSLAEIEYLHKPSILVPLGTEASRGDQIENAQIFCKTGPCRVINEGRGFAEKFFRAAGELLTKPGKWHNTNESATARIVNIILETA